MTQMNLVSQQEISNTVRTAVKFYLKHFSRMLNKIKQFALKTICLVKKEEKKNNNFAAK